MVRGVSGCFLAVVVGLAVAPNAGQAQIFNKLASAFCLDCKKPHHNCGCSAPAPAPVCQSGCQTPVCQTNCQTPVVQTRYRPVQNVTYRDVSQTRYRQEAQMETVPVTAYKSVTVDEGSYQQIWVPKVVTRQVPTTAYQQRVSYKTVPYQVNQRVAQVHTSYVAEQSVGYVNSQTAWAPQTYGAYGYQGYASNWGRPMYQTAVVPPVTATIPQHYSTLPQTAAVPTMPALTIPSQHAAHLPRQQTPELADPSPVPDPKFMDTPTANADWTPIPSRGGGIRSADNSPLGNFRVANPGEQSVPRTSSQATGKFVPAPSAATVWQTPRGRTQFR